jgi:hypothetical protein
MTYRIERSSVDSRPTFRLSGSVKADQLEELKELIGPLSEPAILDLEELKLVDRDVVAYLRLCEANGIELRNCPPYVCEWILAENDNGTSHEHE